LWKLPPQKGNFPAMVSEFDLLHTIGLERRETGKRIQGVRNLEIQESGAKKQNSFFLKKPRIKQKKQEEKVGGEEGIAREEGFHQGLGEGASQKNFVNQLFQEGGIRKEKKPKKKKDTASRILQVPAERGGGLGLGKTRV